MTKPRWVPSSYVLPAPKELIVPYLSQVFFLFTLFDSDESGTLNCSELKQVLEATMRDNGVIFDEEEIRNLAAVLIEESGGGCAEKGGGRGITYKEMRDMLDRQSGLASAMASRLVAKVYQKTVLPNSRSYGLVWTPGWSLPSRVRNR